MNKEELAAEAQRAVEELIEVSGCRAGQVLVVGCSTSEIVGGKIGTCGSEEAAQAYRGQFVQFIMTCSAEINHPLCQFKRWCKLGYRCAVFEKHWVLAYQILDEGIIIQDMCHTAILKE